MFGSKTFEESLKVDNETMEQIHAVEKAYQKQGRKLEFRDKIALAVYNAILDLEPQNIDEKIMQTEYMMNLNKIICNYEELRPLLTKFFENKKIRGE